VLKAQVLYSTKFFLTELKRLEFSNRTITDKENLKDLRIEKAEKIKNITRGYRPLKFNISVSY
jgi:hypothetical protein